ncbi:hypothetical protein ZWY2020_034774 [Hordeum vulgare]|nr:hypothetical protein ZWY2020_034774 [Hordeum vulgare]
MATTPTTRKRAGQRGVSTESSPWNARKARRGLSRSMTASDSKKIAGGAKEGEGVVRSTPGLSSWARKKRRIQAELAGKVVGLGGDGGRGYDRAATTVALGSDGGTEGRGQIEWGLAGERSSRRGGVLILFAASPARWSSGDAHATRHVAVRLDRWRGEGEVG